MIELAEYFNLSECTLLSLKVHELETVVDLDSYPLAGGFVNGLTHYRIGSTADLLSQLVVREV